MSVPYSRAEVCSLLNQCLADCIDLERRAIQAHWNTNGQDGDALKPWFQDLRDTSSQAGERIARRITELGGVAEATVSAVAEHSGLSEYDRRTVSGWAHRDAIAKTLSVFILALGDDIDLLSRYGDESSQLLLVDTMLSVGRYIRFAKS